MVIQAQALDLLAAPLGVTLSLRARQKAPVVLSPTPTACPGPSPAVPQAYHHILLWHLLYASHDVSERIVWRKCASSSRFCPGQAVGVGLGVAGIVRDDGARIIIRSTSWLEVIRTGNIRG
nr:MAG TPA: hypothetical protein [Caudoviricetes sp.]